MTFIPHKPVSCVWKIPKNCCEPSSQIIPAWSRAILRQVWNRKELAKHCKCKGSGGDDGVRDYGFHNLGDFAATGLVNVSGLGDQQLRSLMTRRLRARFVSEKRHPPLIFSTRDAHGASLPVDVLPLQGEVLAGACGGGECDCEDWAVSRLHRSLKKTSRLFRRQYAPPLLGSMVSSPRSLNRPPFISHMFSIAGSSTGAEREVSQGRVLCAVLRSERSAEP